MTKEIFGRNYLVDSLSFPRSGSQMLLVLAYRLCILKGFDLCTLFLRLLEQLVSGRIWPKGGPRGILKDVQRETGVSSPPLSLSLHLQQLQVSSVAPRPARLAWSKYRFSHDEGTGLWLNFLFFLFSQPRHGCGLVTSPSTCLMSQLFYYLCKKLPALNFLCFKYFQCLRFPS